MLHASAFLHQNNRGFNSFGITLRNLRQLSDTSKVLLHWKWGNWGKKSLHNIALCPFHSSSETTPSNLDWQGQRTKKPQWLAFLNKDSFLLARVVLSRELLNMLYVFPPQVFPNIFSRQKEKPISSCLAGSCAMTKRRHFNHGYVLSMFYQVLLFTKNN